MKSKHSKKLSDNDFLTIEKIYRIKLPIEFKVIYSNSNYLSEGLYDWGNFSRENVGMLKQLIKEAKNGVYRNINDIEWNNEWGEEPSKIDERENIIKRKLSSAPDLIPIRGHCYIAALDVEKSPVVSIVDTDIVYYSFDLKGYFSKQKIPKGTPLSVLPYIPFWTDLM